MEANERQALLRTVFECQSCPESYGFSRPAAGRPYFKFPPIIGAEGPKDVLFAGINPRLEGNEALHSRLMGDYGAFEDLARNWDGEQTYIAAGGPEHHYEAHIAVLKRALGPEATFQDNAAVTELFLCASPHSGKLPLSGSKCADKYFERVLRLVSPGVVVCVGSPAWRYMRKHYGRPGEPVCARVGELKPRVVRMPHPNSEMPATQRQRELGEAVAGVKAALGVR
jgi:uracil-DNA glycosylase